MLRAKDRKLHREVAIKRPLSNSAAVHARFEREALITARLQHPSIVPVYEAGRAPSGEPFYAMRLVAEGRSLKTLLAETRTLDERLAMLPHLIAVVDALAYAHDQKIVHRDLKPSNILVGPFGETVVVDWGLAKDLTSADDAAAAEGTKHDAELTADGAVLGTPCYMAPEQASSLPVDERADVYALGAVLYHLLAGRPPYEGSAEDVLAQVREHSPPSPAEPRSGAPPELVAIVATAMHREPSRRYATAREMAADLHRFATGQLVAAHRYTPWQLLRRYGANHPLRVGIVLVLCIAALSGTTMIVARQLRRRAALAEKGAIDREIAELEARIATAAPEEIAPLEERLENAVARVGAAAAALDRLGLHEAALPPGDAVDGALHRLLARLDADVYAIPPHFRAAVHHEVERMTRERAAVVSAQNAAVWRVVRAELAHAGVPAELAYVALVESGLDSRAASSRGAVGVWQLMAPVARDYGLRVDDAVDERSDATLASRAAARIFADLLTQFGADAALIAIATYNMGVGRTSAILRQMASEPGSWRRSKRSFWHLYRVRKLTAEAMHYVALIVAAAICDGAGAERAGRAIGARPS